MEVYAAALASAPPKDATLRPKAAPGTFDALAVRYFGSAQYLSLSVTSRANYRRVIGSFLKEHGHRLVRQMTREHVDIMVGKMANKPGAGIILLKRVRTLVRYAIALGWIDRDPTAGANSYRSKEIHTWNEEEIAAFEKHRRAVLLASRRGRLIGVRVCVFAARRGKRLTGTKCGQAKREQPNQGKRARSCSKVHADRGGLTTLLEDLAHQGITIMKSVSLPVSGLKP
jgi:hypothetical protein